MTKSLSNYSSLNVWVIQWMNSTLAIDFALYSFYLLLVSFRKSYSTYLPAVCHLSYLKPSYSFVICHSKFSSFYIFAFWACRQSMLDKRKDFLLVTTRAHILVLYLNQLKNLRTRQIDMQNANQLLTDYARIRYT